MLVLAFLFAASRGYLEEAKLFTGGRERLLQKCSCLTGHREMHASPAMQKVTATSLFSLTGSFQKVTRYISDITQMAVSRCLNFWKLGYVIMINAASPEYSTEILAVGGGHLTSWHKNMMDVKGSHVLSLAGPGWPWPALAWLSVLMASAL